MTEKIIINYKGRVMVREVCPECRRAWKDVEGVVISDMGKADGVKMFGICLEEPCISFLAAVEFQGQEMTTEV